ncbi:MAG TPA: exosortase/archaeosortase family protein [Methylomirabilota bacterium]|nr:exosortase/archaeosortase family protein [Methylomirabilota bacterium]
MNRRPLLEWCLLLVVVTFYLPTMAEIGHAWSTHRYAGHGIFVPVLSLVMLWTRRHQLRHPPGPRAPEGLAFLGAGVVLAGVGHATQRVEAHVVSTVLAVAGIALWLRGPRWMRQAAAPFAFLLFMLPLPQAAVTAVTLPLQHFAAGFAAGSLALLHIPASQAGVLIHLTDLNLRVDESCNGLRFLMVLLVVITAFALIYVPTRSRRLVVIVTAVVAGVVANALRVTTIAAATHVLGPQAALGSLHDYAGRAIWLLALAWTLGFGVLMVCNAAPRRTRPRPLVWPGRNR